MFFFTFQTLPGLVHFMLKILSSLLCYDSSILYALRIKFNIQPYKMKYNKNSVQTISWYFEANLKIDLPTAPLSLWYRRPGFNP